MSNNFNSHGFQNHLTSSNPATTTPSGTKKTSKLPVGHSSAESPDSDEQPKPSKTNSAKPSGKGSKHNKSPQESSSSSDHTDRDGVKWGSKTGRIAVRQVKNAHDSAVHAAVSQGDPRRLQQLIQAGLSLQHKSIDGSTPLHRAAEVGSIECAKILAQQSSENNTVDLNAENNLGHTPFHIAALNQQVELGYILRRNGARIQCQEGCTKCRWLSKMIHRRYQQYQRVQNLEEQSSRIINDRPKGSTQQLGSNLQIVNEGLPENDEESIRHSAVDFISPTANTAQTEPKKKKQKKPKLQPNNDLSTEEIERDLLALEIAKVKQEMKGPYLDKNQNKSLRQAQRQARKQSELEDQGLASVKSSTQFDQTTIKTSSQYSATGTCSANVHNMTSTAANIANPKHQPTKMSLTAHKMNNSAAKSNLMGGFDKQNDEYGGELPPSLVEKLALNNRLSPPSSPDSGSFLWEEEKKGGSLR